MSNAHTSDQFRISNIKRNPVNYSKLVFSDDAGGDGLV
jgi:hypothetical protein